MRETTKADWKAVPSRRTCGRRSSMLGFHTARVEVVGLSDDCSVEEYLADRELSAGGRFGRHVLGDTEWRRFLERAGAEFRRKFGDRVGYERPLVLALGTTC